MSIRCKNRCWYVVLSSVDITPVLLGELAFLNMANRLEISDEAWRVIQPILVAHQSVRILSEEPCWAFLEAVLWVL